MTAFRCRLGLFGWFVTPFGLVNAPASFQRYINENLRDNSDISATVYMDDVLIFTDGDENNHWKTVQKILKKLDEADLFFGYLEM